MEKRDIRKILAYFSYMNDGEWDKIYMDLKDKKPVVYEEVEQFLEKHPTPFITILDPNFPESLKNTYKPPFVLFYYGDISLIENEKNNISVVGCREPSSYGKKMADSIVGEVAKKYVIVSGMARGIDSLAHKAAIKNNGKTIAVLGSGIDNCYPKENESLYQEIKKHHLVVSEYPGVTKADSSHFPIRNRIISALSQALLIIEAKRKSGTSITAKLALEQNKDILCVPTHADEESLCNYYISQGAYLIESGEEVIKHLKSLV